MAACAEDLHHATVAVLKEWCQDFGIQPQGKKEDIIRQICAHMLATSEAPASSEDLQAGTAAPTGPGPVRRRCRVKTRDPNVSSKPLESSSGAHSTADSSVQEETSTHAAAVAADGSPARDTCETITADPIAPQDESTTSAGDGVLEQEPRDDAELQTRSAGSKHLAPDSSTCTTDNLEVLLSMGFDQKTSKSALKQHSNIEAAVEFIMAQAERAARRNRTSRKRKCAEVAAETSTSAVASADPGRSSRPSKAAKSDARSGTSPAEQSEALQPTPCNRLLSPETTRSSLPVTDSSQPLSAMVPDWRAAVANAGRTSTPPRKTMGFGARNKRWRMSIQQLSPLRPAPESLSPLAGGVEKLAAQYVREHRGSEGGGAGFPSEPVPASPCTRPVAPGCVTPEGKCVNEVPQVKERSDECGQLSATQAVQALVRLSVAAAERDTTTCEARLVDLSNGMIHVLPHDGVVAIGRCPGSDIIVASPDADSRHCVLLCCEGSVQVEEVGSKGTFVNDLLVPKGDFLPQRVLLRRGDTLILAHDDGPKFLFLDGRGRSSLGGA